MKKYSFISALCGTAFCVLMLASPAAAQSDPGSGGPAPGPTPPAAGGDPTGVPLDGGASLLLASGVAYGLKRLRDRRARR